MADVSSRSASGIFDQGLSAMIDGNFVDAAAFFQRALDIERQRRTRRSEMRYLSYYGLSLARAGGPAITALDCCREAVRLDPGDPDLYLNLGLTSLVYSDKNGAMSAFGHGLELAPYHPILLREFVRGDRRRPVALSMLQRDHFLNRSVGRLRAFFENRLTREPVPNPAEPI